MADILTITIPLGSRYPSRNHEGRDGARFGRKSPEYLDLTDAVIAAAQAEMERTGWTVAECECLAIFTRYMPTHLRADAINIAGCEANALTKAGVWTDDRLAQPCLKHIRYDDEGPHRITIVVMKLYEPANVRIVARGMEARQRRNAKRSDPEGATARSGTDAPEKAPIAELRNSAISRIKYEGQPIPDGYAVVNGFLEPFDIKAYLKRTG